jgi:formylglycine-generating enzyme
LPLRAPRRRGLKARRTEMWRAIALAALLPLTPVLQASDSVYVKVPAGELVSVLKFEDSTGAQAVAAFELMRLPVSNTDFLRFVRQHSQWQKSKVPSVFADRSSYLASWKSDLELDATALPNQPMVQVSWFAASAYCEAQGARLPTWSQWEYVAAADEKRRDARDDPAWREHILSWYSKPSNTPLAEIGQRPANVYGIQDLHGLIWEWIDDFSALLVVGDNRNQNNTELAQFCGAGALSVQERENYAVMMRVALLSSLSASSSTSNLGFRCARNAAPGVLP